MLKKLTAVTLLIGLTTIIQAQEEEYNPIAWKFAETITEQELEEHLYIIASDKFEGRETGKKGQKMTMEYLINNFKSYGIQPTAQSEFIQTFDLIEQTPQGVELTVGKNKVELLKDFSISPSIILDKKVKTQLVFVGHGIESKKTDNYASLNVKGKAVFILDGTPSNYKGEKEWNMKQKIELAKSKGASLIMYHSVKLEGNLQKYEHHYSKPKLALLDGVNREAMVVIAATTEFTKKIVKEAGLSWKKLLKKGVKKGVSVSLPVELKVKKPTEYLTSENVLAYIPGEENPEEVVVISAHYDHIGMNDDEVFNGADDDGTGTVALLELAQAFQLAVDAGFQPKRSILIMPVSGEEKGLLGSKYYTDNPIFELENTVANLNIDMIGRYDENHPKDDPSKSNYVYLIGSDKLSKELHQVSERTNELYTKIDLDYTFNDDNDPNRFYYRSDHYNFAKNNIPVIFYFNGVHEDYHKSTDTPEKIDYKKTEKITRLVFLTAWEIANREQRIELDKID